MPIPAEVTKSIRTKLQKDSAEITLKDFKAASGGCISNGGRLTTSKGSYFLKWNSSKKFPGIFKAEASGLQLLSSADVIKIPAVICFDEEKEYSWILMEYIDSSSKLTNYWELLGEQLGSLHKNTSDKYGLNHSNYIGSIIQKNNSLNNWIEFLVTQRFEPMVELALNNNKVDNSIARDFEKLYGKLQGLLVYEKPSLLHGDLWGGNLMISADGKPALIDPAVYYGNREIEIAFTTLFGGFDRKFYESYRSNFPLEDGFEERFELYNLYPLMVHVNIFGGSYVNQVQNVLKRFN